jgi:hypothetical protein
MLNKEEQYRAAAAKSIHTTQRLNQGFPRVSGLGHHPLMEKELADYIRKAREMGVPGDVDDTGGGKNSSFKTSVLTIP